MTCPACGAENEAAASFCFRCGTRLQPDAPATGQTVSLRPGDTPPFGLPVAQQAPRPESSVSNSRVYDAPAALVPAAPQAAEPRAFTVPSPGVPAGSVPPTSNNANVSLVLGLVGQLVFWLLACVSLGSLSILAVAAGIPAVLVGRNALREIRASNGRIGGEGVARAGVIIGWITIGLSVISLIIVVAVVGGLVIFAS